MMINYLFSHRHIPKCCFQFDLSHQFKSHCFQRQICVLLLAQLSDAGWVKVCTENDRPGLSLIVFLYMSRLLPFTMGTNFPFPASVLEATLTTHHNDMHLLFLQAQSSELVSYGSAEKHERVQFVLLKTLIYPEWQQVKYLQQMVIASVSLPTPTESHCVAQAGLELNNPSTSAL